MPQNPRGTNLGKCAWAARHLHKPKKEHSQEWLCHKTLGLQTWESAFGRRATYTNQRKSTAKSGCATKPSGDKLGKVRLGGAPLTQTKERAQPRVAVPHPRAAACWWTGACSKIIAMAPSRRIGIFERVQIGRVAFLGLGLSLRLGNIRCGDCVQLCSGCFVGAGATAYYA